MKHAPLALAPLLGGCLSMVSPAPTSLSGSWGGEHIGLVMQGGLGDIEYDCASGTIDTAIVPPKSGAFTAVGTHRTGQGGPVRVGQIFRSQRAKYAGTVIKDEMKLTVTLEDGTVMGPFTLYRGAQPNLTRCR